MKNFNLMARELEAKIANQEMIAQEDITKATELARANSKHENIALYAAIKDRHERQQQQIAKQQEEEPMLKMPKQQLEEMLNKALDNVFGKQEGAEQ